MKEVWKDIRSFPEYAVSTWGRIMNLRNERIKDPAVNQQGIPYVNLSVDKRQTVRSVPLLVADAFVTRRGIPEHFDTPTHLDGDRTNCYAENLVWRPRWFAMKYHKQFHPAERGKALSIMTPIMDMDTEEVFENSWDAALKLGLIENDIYVSIFNRTYVSLFNRRFIILETQDQ